MSYILDVLKKLETDNKNSERNVDLKEAILKDNIISAPRKKKLKLSPLFVGLTASLLTIILLFGAGALYYFFFTDKNEKVMAQPSMIKSETEASHNAQNAAVNEKTPQKASHSLDNTKNEKKGITLASLKKEKKKTVPSSQSPQSTKREPPDKRDSVKKTALSRGKERIPLSLKKPEESLSMAEKRTDQELNKRTQISQKAKNEEKDNSSASDDSDDLPFFKIKGAMYIGVGEKANYVLIEFNERTHRIKEGESADGLMLLKMHSDKGFFRYNKKDFMKSF